MIRIGVLAAALLAASPVLGNTAAEAYREIGLDVKDVLSGTSLTAKVIPGKTEQFVTITTFLTGGREKSDAVDVRLDVFERAGGRLVSVYTRDFGAENGGFVGDGNLQLIDLDLDGVNEIIVSYESYADPLIRQVIGEVLLHEEDGFRTAWSGPMKYDATKAARELPTERRDRFEREIDLGATLRTRGVTLFLNKQVIAVAGERLPEPKVVQETFPLRIRKEY
jgi:hypothetical protein